MERTPLKTLALIVAFINIISIFSQISVNANVISSSSISQPNNPKARYISNVNFDEDSEDEEDEPIRSRRSLKATYVALPENYSVHTPPPPIQGTPIDVQFSILIFNVFDIKEIQGDLSLEVNLKVYWKDTRLANWTSNIESGEKYTVLSPSLLNKIWHPDVFIDHLKSIQQPALISKPASLRIYPDGSLRYSTRMLILMSCRMDFYYYPADTQRCSLNLKSYAFSTKHLTLSWKDSQGALIAYPVYVHNFDIAIDTDPNFLQQTKSTNYSGISFSVFLRRKLSYHIIQTFIPSALFTIVSWLSFLVPPESTPGRMALCVTTLLTLTAMFAAVRQNTPSVSYIKALDLWMVTCIIFVFSVLVEYTVVLKLRSMTDDKPRKKDKVQGDGSQDLRPDNIRCVSVSSSESSPPKVKRSNLLVGSAASFEDKSVADPLLSLRPLIPSSSPMPSPPLGLIINSEDKKGPSSYFKLACKIETYVPRLMPLAFLLFSCFYWPYLLFCSNYYMLRDDGQMYYSL